MKKKTDEEEILTPSGRSRSAYRGSYEDDKELQAIFERTFGSVQKEKYAFQKRVVHAAGADYGGAVVRRKEQEQEEYLLVDGYNIIFAWEELKELADANIHAAQDKLMDVLSNYQGIRKCHLILVFDAYKVEGHAEEVFKYHNIYVVYTKEAETADQYIEKTVHKLGKQYQVTVATSDRLEQMIILGQGASRLSAAGLYEDVMQAAAELKQEWHLRRQSSKNYLFDSLSEEMAEEMEEVRLGKKQFGKDKHDGHME